MRASHSFLSFLLSSVLVETFLASSSITRNTSGSLFATKNNALESTTTEDITETYAQIPLKVAVAGGGVGGMFTAYALQQKGFDVTLFEKASKFSRFGGPIQLASNALSCINALSPDLFDEIMTRFTFTGTRKCGIKVSERNSQHPLFKILLYYSLPLPMNEVPTPFL